MNDSAIAQIFLAGFKDGVDSLIDAWDDIETKENSPEKQVVEFSKLINELKAMRAAAEAEATTV